MARAAAVSHARIDAGLKRVRRRARYVGYLAVALGRVDAVGPVDAAEHGEDDVAVGRLQGRPIYFGAWVLCEPRCARGDWG